MNSRTCTATLQSCHLENLEGRIFHQGVVVAGFRLVLAYGPDQKDDSDCGQEGRCSLFGLQESGTGALLQSLSEPDERIADILAEEFSALAGFSRNEFSKLLLCPFDDGLIHRKSGTQMVIVRHIGNLHCIDMPHLANCLARIQGRSFIARRQIRPTPNLNFPSLSSKWEGSNWLKRAAVPWYAMAIV